MRQKRYLINFLSLKVVETSLKSNGLQLNKKGYAYGFILQAPNLIEATDALMAVEKRWGGWVNDYNTWVGMAPAERLKYIRRSST